MARGSADHSYWRELIATRLDRPLSRSETRALAGHLRECASCRQADHDFREGRFLLRALPSRPAPRDLWPRTSAALDRAVARGTSRRVRLWRGLPRRATVSPAAAATTLAGLGLIAVVAVMQMMPALSVTPTGGPAEATPFAVAPQQLAWVGSVATDLFVYQTHIGHVCPPSAETCGVDDDIVRTPVNLPASVHARNVALSPSGNALALVGRDLNRDVIAVVILPQNGDNPSSQPGETPHPDATDSPPDGPDATPDGQPTDLPGPSGPPASAVAGLQVLAILENVESAGAPPAWSPSGAMLAFSAMPADGSHGPDVYIWSPSDAVARPITTDHGSYFASWTGERIVLGRVGTDGDGSPRARTFVIDPSTLEERAAAGPSLWLPVVNPSGTKAVAWRGDLDTSTGLAVPVSGTLGMVDWAAIDPFAPGNEPVATLEPTDAPTATSVPPTDAPTSTPGVSPSTSGTPTSASPTNTPQVQSTDAPVTPDLTGEPTVLPIGWTELDLGHDASDAAVVEWQVRWSLDGQVLGVWIADAEGTTWGRLTVFAVDPDTGQADPRDALLVPSLARRGFSLGQSRVAWVAPSDDNPDGELRVRTWGDDGVGGLRLLPAELEEVLPAF